MLREEFETRMGNTVTPEAFEDIHRLYICSGNMDKDSFCDDYKLHGTSKILAEIWKLYKDTQAALDCYKREHQEAAEMLVRFSYDYNIREAYEQADAMIGQRGIIRYKIERGIELTSEEKDYILRKI